MEGMDLSMAEFWDVLDRDGNKTGLLRERGPMKKGEYHLIVHVWIINEKGDFLLSKRAPNKMPHAGFWESTGGSAVAGDDSLQTALKEVKEELGITLDPKNGEVFKHYARHFENGSGDFVDVWLFRQEVDLSEVVFQVDETCDAMLADKEKIKQMIDDGLFIGRDIFPYIDELFALV